MIKKHIINVPDVEAVGVYAIHNKKNDKYYIGSSVNVKTRLKTHQRNMEKLQGSNLKMDEDFKTFEELNDFEFLVLKTFPDNTITDYELRKTEKEFIEKYEAYKGYNNESHEPVSTGFYSKNELLRCKKTRPKAYKKLDHSDISKMTDYELVNALIITSEKPEEYRTLISMLKYQILLRMDKQRII